ncbi:hypothetical protein [Actinoplanes sp. NPDC051494]|uniref:hypothetical protein n=1 Tax=Actinoplanes sp. NPDC051494 TaxID=3363907 RepID=UPI00378DC648
MTERPPENGSPNGDGPRNPFRRHGLAILAIGGAVSSAIQIVTTGRPTTQGLIIAGVILGAGFAPLTYQIGRNRRRNDGTGVPIIDYLMLEQERDALMDRVESYELELQNIRSALEAAFGSTRPYSDEMQIIFDIGTRPSSDHVEESHITMAREGEVVHWYALEAFSRGREQAMHWREVVTHLTRVRAIGHEQVTAVELTSALTPRALITFAPPQRSVRWEVRYRCPGYWDKLRQGGQRFEWMPPPASPGEDNGRRSSARAVTFIFRIPTTLGTLKAYDLPKGVAFEQAAADAHDRTYRIGIADLSALLEPPGTGIDPIKWYLELSPEGAL